MKKDKNESNKQTKGMIAPVVYDTNFTYINRIPVPVHFYFINDYLSQSVDKYETCYEIPSHSGRVMTMLYTPFINHSDIDLVKIPYDTDYFGKLTGYSGSHDKESYVFKVMNNSNSYVDKQIGTINAVQKIQRSENYSWQNEAKLFRFPYSYITINDYINQPFIIDNNYLTTGTLQVRVRTPISYNSSYTIYVPGYKQDNRGNFEGLVSSVPMELPTGGTSFSQFMTNSKSQFLAHQIASSNNEKFARFQLNNNSNMNWQQNEFNAMMGIGNTLVDGIGGVVGGLLNLQIGSAINSAVGGMKNVANIGLNRSMEQYKIKNNYGVGLLQNSLSTFNRVNQAQAQINDIINAPKNISLGQGDILQSLSNSQRRIDMIRYRPTQYNIDRIARYFTMYGYKLNKYIELRHHSITSRKYWNFIKTINSNVRCKHNYAKHKLDSIFNNGITFWHCENMIEAGLYVGDYFVKDNYEVSMGASNDKYQGDVNEFYVPPTYRDNEIIKPFNENNEEEQDGLIRTNNTID